VEIAIVLLQPMKEDPPLNTKCKDKFLVQTTFITPEREQGSISELVRHSLYPQRRRRALISFLRGGLVVGGGRTDRRREWDPPAEAEGRVPPAGGGWHP
jgi:hypothetical protein